MGRLSCSRVGFVDSNRISVSLSAAETVQTHTLGTHDRHKYSLRR